MVLVSPFYWLTRPYLFRFFALQAAFEDFGIMPELIKAIEELGWELPRDVQAEVIPLILGGGDVMCVSEFVVVFFFFFFFVFGWLAFKLFSFVLSPRLPKLVQAKLE
jgi:hypothetical protein